MNGEAIDQTVNGGAPGARDTIAGPQAATWRRHPVDIRVSLPFLRTRVYFTFVAGRERRRAERRDQERHVNPLLTLGNIMFSLGVATIFMLAAMAALILQSAIIE